MANPFPQLFGNGVGVYSADWANGLVQGVLNFAQLRTFTGNNDSIAQVLGGVSENDGLQGVFYYSSTSTATDNNSTVIVPNGAIIGAWLRLSAYQGQQTGVPIVVALSASVDNTTAIQAAVTAATSTGNSVCLFGSGTMLSQVTISGPVLIYGQGAGSTVLTTGGTGIAFAVTGAGAVVMRDFAMTSVGQGATAIQIGANSTQNSLSRFQNLSFTNYFVGIDFAAAANFVVDACAFALGSRVNAIGVKVRNIANPSFGDSTISGGTQFTGSGTGQFGVDFISSGGLKIEDCKFIVYTAINMAMAATATDLVVTGNSIEGFQNGITLQRSGSPFTFSNVVISGNQFASTNATCIGINAPLDGAGAWLNGISITGNTFTLGGSSADTAILLNSTTGFTISGNTTTFLGSSTSNVFLNAGSSATYGYLGVNVTVGVVGPNTLAGANTNIVSPELAVNILDYGGDPTGTNFSDTAFANAIAAATARNPNLIAILFPVGHFKFSAQLSVTLPNAVASFSLTGVDTDITILDWPNGNGLAVTLVTGINSVHVRNCSFVSGTANPSTSPGLFLNQTEATDAGSVTTNSDIQNVTFRGNDGYAVANYWGTAAVSIFGMQSVDFINCNFVGPTVAGYNGPGNGVVLQGTALLPPVIFNFIGCNFQYLNNSIYYGDYVQGVTVTNSNFNGVLYGIVSSATTNDKSELIVSCSQFNMRGAAVFCQSLIPVMTFANNFVFINFSSIGVAQTVAGLFTITGNCFTAGVSMTSSTVGVQITATSSSWPGVITGNCFLNIMGTAVVLGASSTGVNLQSNAYHGNGSNLNNTGSGNTIGGGST